MQIEADNLLISSACNVEYEVFDWFGGVIAYGSHNLVYLYDVEKVKILATLKGHKGRVNSVKFLQDGKIVSVCSEGDIRVWSNTNFEEGKIGEFLENPKLQEKWKNIGTQSYKGINFVNICIRETGQNSFDIVGVTTKSDLRFLGASVSENQESINFVEHEILDFGNNLLESCKFTTFKDSLYLIVSSSDFKIHIYEIISSSEAGKTKQLEYRNSLLGHSDKVGAIATAATTGQNASTYIATASKDKYIRIWRFSEEVSPEILGSVMKRNIYKVGEVFVHLESNLLSHEDSVSSVQFAFNKPDSTDDRDLIMVSSGFDFSVLIWERETQSQVKITSHFRFGWIQ